MVSVLATAHMHPARMAQTTRCGAWATSVRICAVPRTRAGTLHRARKTPQTITRETAIGEISGLTSLMGASAPPSHAPAAKPQNMPKACRLRSRVRLELDSETAAGGLGSRELTGVYPAGILRQGARKRESRSEYRLRWLGTCCGNYARLDSPISKPRREVVRCGDILGIDEVWSQRGGGYYALRGKCYTPDASARRRK